MRTLMSVLVRYGSLMCCSLSSGALSQRLGTAVWGLSGLGDHADGRASEEEVGMNAVFMVTLCLGFSCC